MANPTDNSKSKTLLDPELNPIMNPLLAAHMGRWAEVYFTTPPERREQAVADLVRELGGDAGPSSVERAGNLSRDEVTPDAKGPRPSIPPPPSRPMQAAIPPVPVQPPSYQDADEFEAFKKEIDSFNFEPEVPRDLNPTPSVSASARTGFQPATVFEPATLEDPENAAAPAVCESCGHLNGAGQKYCGMCGRATAGQPALPVEPWIGSQPDFSEKTVTQIEREAPTPSRQAKNWLSESAAPIATGPLSDLTRRPQGGYFIDPPPVSADANLRPRGTSPPEGPYPDPPHRSYGVYISLIMVLLLAWAAYATWRTNSVKRVSPPAELPSTAPSSSLQSPSSNGPEPAAANPTTAVDMAPKQPQKGGVPAGKINTVSTKASGKPALLPKPQPAPHRETAAVGSDQNGADELTAADEDLRAGNTQQAVDWLWKSVAKQNSIAALTLSNLYLKGEGVPKSCDQARVLLDAAARRGESAAAQRLKNLAAYGCQ